MNNQTVWDKTNIGENYPGITLPLTYSFIRLAYSKVYPNFLKIIGLSDKNIKEHDYVFENMLGYINGEIFYNINNWYELIKLIPGYKYNKKFFENMLEPVEKKPLEPVSRSYKDIFSLIYNLSVLWGFIKSIIFIGPYYKKFDSGFNKGIAYYTKLNLRNLNNHKLTQELADIEYNFFSLWGYTIINDFRVMVFFGLFTCFIKKEFSASQDFIAKHIYGINSKPESVMLLTDLIEISIKVKKNGHVSISWNGLKEQDLEIYNLVVKYLDNYGERSFNELKLEESSFMDSPDHLISLINYYSTIPLADLNRYTSASTEDRLPIDNLADKLSFFKKIIYNLLYGITITSIHKREEYRLKRAKVFKIANDFFKEMAVRLFKEKLIVKQRDIYYLYKSEVLDTLKNHRLEEDMGALISRRMKKLRDYENRRLPRRVITSSIYTIKDDKYKKTNTLEKKGIVTSYGNINGGVILLMPRLNFNSDVKDKILVTHATDPGWTVLFPSLKGIVIEVGGLLSHASIVARELGIPCIVLPNALNLLKNGEIINMNSSTGIIEIVKHENIK